MKKVLILANDFPPLNTPGALRAFSFFKYLARYGYSPIVVTRHWSADQATTESKHLPSKERFVELETHEFGLIYRVPFRGDLRDRVIGIFGLGGLVTIRKLLTVLISFSKYHSFLADNLSGIYRQALEVCKNTKIDFLVATGEPFVLFRHAALISNELGVPWVADYRDGWSTHHLRANPQSLMRKLVLNYERRVEVKTLRSAAFFTTVSRYLAGEIAELIKRPGVEIPNGAELDHYPETISSQSNGAFRIVYTGTVFDKPYIEILCNGIKRFVEEQKPANVEVLFVGIESGAEPAVRRIRALSREFSHIVKVVPSVAPDVAANFQSNASILICLVAGSQAKGVMGAKLYSYAATRNPIVSVPCEPGSLTDFFPGRDIQRFAFNSEELVDALRMYYARHLAGESLKTSITDQEMFSISREYQVREFARHLDKFAAGASKHRIIDEDAAQLGSPSLSHRSEYH